MPYFAEAGRTLLSIGSHYNGLSKSEKKVASYIAEHPEEVIYASVTELAEKADVGETTVLRLCRKLKFNGFQDFKLSLAQDLAKKLEPAYKENDESGDHLSLKIVTSQIHALEHTRLLMDAKHIDEVVDAMLQAKRILFFGVGTSGLTAAHAARVFARIGMRTSAVMDSHFQAIDAALMDKQDLAVGLSVSGSTKDTVDNLKLARKSGGITVAITSNARSPVTKQADMVLLTASRENPLQGSSLSAAISQLSIIDILIAAVSLKRKEETASFKEQTARALADRLY